MEVSPLGKVPPRKSAAWGLGLGLVLEVGLGVRGRNPSNPNTSNPNPSNPNPSNPNPKGYFS